MCEGCEERWPLPVGKKWKYIGNCSCRGNDMDCAEDDAQWEMVDADG